MVAGVTDFNGHAKSRSHGGTLRLRMRDLNETTKEEVMNTRIKQYLVAVGVMVALAGSKAWAVTGTVDGTITVTPIVTVSLSLSPTTYAYGQLAVNTSSVSASALTLSNAGSVGVSLTKAISANPANWVADTSSTTANHFILYVATSTARPAVSDFIVANPTDYTSMFGALNNSSSLLGITGNSQNLDPAGGSVPNESLWFRLDMPTGVTTSAGQTIKVTFTGTAL